MQRFLISVVENGPPHKKVCAVRAWYWSQVTLIYRSGEDLRRRQPTPASRAADDDVADLRRQYRNACLTAFVGCEHQPTREWLAHGFLLLDDHYPVHLRPLLARARAIAEAEPKVYRDLLARRSSGTNLAQLGTREPIDHRTVDPSP